MKLFCCFILICVFPVCLHAQSNYQKGYIIKNNKDTLTGFINQKEWATSPELISFKQLKNNDSVMPFSPREILGFVFNDGEKYISYSGPISLDPNQLPDIPGALDTAKKQETVFLREIVNGSHLALYIHSDLIKTRFFIQEKGLEPVEMIYHQYYTEANAYSTKALYKRDLVSLGLKYNPDSQSISEVAERTRFSQSDFEYFLKLINKDDSHKQKIRKPGAALFVGLGINKNRTGFEGSYTPQFSQMDAVTPRLSFGVDVYDNPVVRKLILRAEIALSYINANFSSANYLYGFKQYSASFIPQIIYNVYNKEGFKFYLGAATAINFSRYLKNEFSDRNLTYMDENRYKLQSVWVNFPLKAGIFIGRTEIAFDYAQFAGFTNYQAFAFGTTATSLSLHYFLKKAKSSPGKNY